MATAGAQLQGAGRLVSTLQQAARALAGLEEAQRQAGELLTGAAQATSPRWTGQLASSHGYTVVDTTVEVVAATRYAAAVHALNPWLARTLTARLDQLVELYATGVADALAQVKGT